MGLTLHYKLCAPAPTIEARALVAKMRATALAMKRAGRIEAVAPISSSPGQLAWLSEWLQVPVSGEENCTRGIEVPALAGHVFTVTLGEGSEPLRLGLCRYPDCVSDHQTGRTRAVRRRGWRLAGFCKTQYASLHGWEHFLRCHVAAVEMLVGLSALGVEVEINDEGGYWPGRDVEVLRRSVERLNGIVAAFAGAMKDASDDDGTAPVQSPIFAHPQFERIEAEGHTANAAHLRAAADLVRKLKP